ncbi:hypothetical protein ACFVRU_41000 [Streptomyces sp. NPDC057927]
MVKRKTHEQFVKEIFSIVGDEYKVLGTYKNAKTKLQLKHSTCGHTYEVNANSFLNGNRCPKCSKQNRIKTITKTHEQFKQDVFILVGHEYDVIGTYINNRTKIKIRHNSESCNNYIYEVNPYHFLNKQRCPKCTLIRTIKNKTKTHAQFIQEVFDLVGTEYKVLSKYNGTSNKLIMKHNIDKCGHEYEVSPSKFTSTGQRCPKCFGTHKKNTCQFKQDVYDLTGYQYKVLDEYVNAKTKITIKHEICEHEWSITPNDFLRGKRCPYCNESKGEKAISNWLNNNKIKYISQFKFNDCKYKKTLPFDFAIFDDSNILQCLVEYDGELHYISVKHFGGEKKFEKTQRNDQIKNDYCKQNNIPLLRIPYWEFDNIEDIIKNKVSELNQVRHIPQTSKCIEES